MDPVRLRAILFVPVAASLIAGVLSGLARLGVPMPDAINGLVNVHGALMTGGFLGTAIGLERAVALKMCWPYLAPLLSGLAALAMIFAVAPGSAPVTMCLAALVMTLACAAVCIRQPLAHHFVLVAAALLWLAGNVVWMVTGEAGPAVPLWAGFLILTITGERLELSRLLPTPRHARIALAIIVIILAAAALAAAFEPATDLGLRVYAGGLLALASWLLRYDIARRNIRSRGLSRYIALCLTTGFVWLGVAAVLGMTGAFQTGAPLRDAALHALLLGFVFSMVFGHAPIILPAVTTLQVRWRNWFYAPLVVLNLGLIVRVIAGLTENYPLRRESALANAVALALFALTLIASLKRRATGNAVARGKASLAPPPLVQPAPLP